MLSSLTLSSSLIVVALVGANETAVAQDAKGATPAAPAAGSTGAAAPAGQEAQLAEDPPPQDIEGTDETPEAPVGEKPLVAAVVTPKMTGYPTEFVARPITLTRGTSEVQLSARSTFSPFISNATLRARYGITRQWQIGLRYNIGGLYKDPTSAKNEFNLGKAAGFDVTYQVQHWIGASLSVPVYLDPVAVSVNIGVPLNFRFGDKVTVGGLGDLLEIRATKFVPSYNIELENELHAQQIKTNTTTSKGRLRFAGFGAYQHKPNLAFIGQLGVTAEDFASNDLRYLMRGGLMFTPKRYLDLGASIGFDDLQAASETFGIELSLAVRI
jgi:hypothetical protein